MAWQITSLLPFEFRLVNYSVVYLTLLHRKWAVKSCWKVSRSRLEWVLIPGSATA